jgi:hypothetical protein
MGISFVDSLLSRRGNIACQAEAAIVADSIGHDSTAQRRCVLEAFIGQAACALLVSALQIGSLEDSAREPGMGQVGIAEIGMAKIDPTQIGPRQVCCLEFRFFQLGIS